MRLPTILLFSLALGACELVEPHANGPVDPATLAPLTGREQSLIYGADGAVQQKNFAAAERDYLSAIAASTGHVDAHLALAKLYEKQGKPVQEREILDRALILQPNHPLANYMRGKLELDALHYAEALAAFERGLKLQPDDIDLNIGKGVANDMLGNHTAAQMVYNRAIQVNPKANLSNIRTNFAMSYLLGGEPKKAADLLQVDAKKPGASTVTRHNLALAYGLLGRNADAKKLLDGEVDEETRLLAVARLREYIKERNDNPSALPLQPTINQVIAPMDSSAKSASKKAAPLGKPFVETLKPAEKPVVAPAKTVAKPAEKTAVAPVKAVEKTVQPVKAAPAPTNAN